MHITAQERDSCESWQIANSAFKKDKPAILPLFNGPELFSSAPDIAKKLKSLLKSFLRALILMIQVSLYLHSLLNLI